MSAEASSSQQVKVNPRGIPHAPFIENVQEHLGADEDVEPTLRKFQETMSKYKFMELNTAQRRSGLESKIPDIRNTLQMVQFLKQKKDDPEPVSTTFELNETLFAKAELDEIDKVHLWLGANVMLSYPLDEAIELLTGKLKGAEKSLEAAKEDLDFLREQITIMEVNTARVHNWDVKRRRDKREQLERESLGNRAETAKASTWLRPDRADRDSKSPKPESSTVSAPLVPTTSATPSQSLPPPPPTDGAPSFLSVFSSPSSLLSSAMVVPPLNFDMVCKGVYRSGHPNERNFGFLKQLGLKSIMYIANDDYRSNMANYAKSEGIQVFHFRLSLNKEPMAEMDEKDVSSALSVLLDQRNLPILVHCNKGKYRVGCLVGLLRRIQGWSHTSIFEEYARFAGSKIADHEYIEVFNLANVRVPHDPAHRPDWL